MNNTTPKSPPNPLSLLRRLHVRDDGNASFPEEPLASSVITLGNFDGLHLAHQALLKRLVSEASKRQAPSVALTFFPHPTQFLRPESSLGLLMPIEERVRKIRALGVDYALALRFDETLAQMDADEFVDLLVSAFNPALFIIGPDTRFGRLRRGDADLLMSKGRLAGFEVLALSTVSVDGQRVSSSGIRHCLSLGDVSTPRSWCEAPFQVAGTVVHGAGRGRVLGFPTANLHSDWPTMPAPGVYVVRCVVNGSNLFFGVANLGNRPTFENPETAEETLEIHLLAEDVPDLYDQEMRVEFLTRLRGEARFPDADALAEQIKTDIVAARRVIERERA